MAEQASYAYGMKRLTSLMKGARVCMMTTEDLDGNLRSRPMALQEADVEGELWFFTARHSDKWAELDHDNRVNISVINPSSYVSVSGTATLVEDKDKAAQLWSAVYRAWFPKGLSDPELVLMKVSIDHAEYWDVPSGPVTTLIGFVKSFATGEQADVGEHQVINAPAPTI